MLWICESAWDGLNWGEFGSLKREATRLNQASGSGSRKVALALNKESKETV